MGNRGKRKKEAHADTIASSLLDLCKAALRGLITLYLWIITGLLPLCFSQGYRGIGTAKFRLFQRVSVGFAPFYAILLVLYSIVWWISNREKQHKSVLSFSATDLFVAFYGAAAVISYLCSDYKETALWGADGWYMGLWTQLILVMVYFGVSRFWKPDVFFYTMTFTVATIVFLLGFCNRFGWYPVKMSHTDPLYLSTVGNINWFCSYLVCIVAFGTGLYLDTDMDKKWKKSVICLCLFTGFMALFVQGSAGGYVTAVLMMVICFALVVNKKLYEKKQLFMFPIILGAGGVVCICRLLFEKNFNYHDTLAYWLSLCFLLFTGILWIAVLFIKKRTKSIRETYAKQMKVLTWLVCGGLLFGMIGYAGLVIITTINPSRFGFLPASVFVFDYKWGSLRGATLRLGAACFTGQDLLHKLVGAGPDCMSCFLYNEGNEGLIELSRLAFKDLTLTNAHCEILTVLVNLGALGAVSYVGAMSAAIWRMLRGKGVAFACGVGLLAYNIYGVFSFQQIVGFWFAILFLAMGEGMLREKNSM